MIILQELEVKGYKSLKVEKLMNFGDFNIIIGPNNSGKTSIFKAIQMLTESDIVGGNYFPEDEECKKIRDKEKDILGLIIPISEEDIYQKRKGKDNVKINYYFSKKYLNELSNENLDSFKSKIEKKMSGEVKTLKHLKSFREKDFRSLKLDLNGGRLYNKHITYLLKQDIWDIVTKSIFYCDDNRLERYKEKSIKDYIKEKDIGTDIIQNKLIGLLQSIVDPRIKSITSHSFDLMMENGFKDTIERQGSGVRSLICLGFDIITAERGNIIMIDEPELGSDPAVKQQFLKFLLEEANEKQIFITTHDPTFVNPILWKKEEFTHRKVRIFIYSIYKEKFVRIDTEGVDKKYLDDPSTFAGYLPHTTSLKDIHLYVEGPGDVGAFQILLHKYLKKKFKQNWLNMLNRTGIYHLAGDHWMHLLHTIPRRPYTCVIILDHNKWDDANDVSFHAFSKKAATPDFDFCNTPEKVTDSLFEGENIPIYILTKNDISDYFRPSNSKDFKKSNLIKIIETKMEMGGRIPKEIEKLFDMIYVSTGFLDISTKKQVVYLFKRLKSQGAKIYYNSSLNKIIISPKGPYKMFGIKIKFSPNMAKLLTNMLKIKNKNDFNKIMNK